MTMAHKGKVLILHESPQEFRELFAERFPDEEFVYAAKTDEIMPAVKAHDPEVIFSIKQSYFSPAEHRKASLSPCVKWFHAGGSGVDHMLPWERDDLIVTNSLGVLAPYLAETVIGAMVSLNGNFPEYARLQARHEWKPIQFRPLSEQTLLIVGLGAIGGKVAELAKALGMKVIAVKRSQTAHHAVDEMHPPEKLKDLVGEADFVSLHVRLSDETHHLFDAQMFSRMKPTAKLMNTARGPVVDEAALADALKNGTIAAAYLDVFEEEPLQADSPLWDMPNVMITPHASDNITGWPVKFADLFSENLRRWRAGEELLNRLQTG